MPQFRIQETDFTAPLKVDPAGLVIKSSPRPYTVRFLKDMPVGTCIESYIAKEKHPLVLIDKRVQQLHMKDSALLAKIPTLSVEATEEFKSMEGVFRLLELMEKSKVTRTSMLFVIGGGIIQDVGSFAAAMYKRGVPWTYVPTTLLGQGDSGVGGKACLNFINTKNLLGLFSAPRQLLIHTGFLKTLSQEEILSGLGEIFRLCLTGGPEFLDRFEELLPAGLKGDAAALNDLIESSLAAKRAVVEYDEFETDIRRAMNLGHSIGHAFEAITHHGIPHGIGVTVGILVESAISRSRGLLSETDYQRLLKLGKPLIPEKTRALLQTIVLDDILDVLRRDKKTEGTVLKLVVVERIGQIRFIDLALEESTIPVLQDALKKVLAAI